MAETNTDYTLEDRGDGQFAIAGRLGYSTVARVLEDSKRLFSDYSTIEVDLSGVTHTDSAGLALLLEWITWANRTVREIRFREIPEKISNIARTSDVEELLSAGERWTGFIQAESEAAEEEEAEPET